jgi:hypothetical protein
MFKGYIFRVSLLVLGINMLYSCGSKIPPPSLMPERPVPFTAGLTNAIPDLLPPIMIKNNLLDNTDKKIIFAVNAVWNEQTKERISLDINGESLISVMKTLLSKKMCSEELCKIQSSNNKLDYIQCNKIDYNKINIDACKSEAKELKTIFYNFDVIMLTENNLKKS